MLCAPTGTGVLFEPCWGSPAAQPPPRQPCPGQLELLFKIQRWSGVRSVRRVHGAVTPLLLLFLLQEELLQRRWAWLHHGAGPDGLQGGSTVTGVSVQQKPGC